MKRQCLCCRLYGFAKFSRHTNAFTPISAERQSTSVGLYPTDAFVAKLNPSGSNLLYSTYLGGESTDGGYGIALDSSNNAYVTGFTYSTNFPNNSKCLAKTNLACPNSVYFNANAFVAEISASGTNLLYSSYFGGTNFDRGEGIAVDGSNYVYVTGFTASTNFPTTNAMQQQFVSVTLTTNAAPTNVVFTTNFFNGYLLNGVPIQPDLPPIDAFVAKFAPVLCRVGLFHFSGRDEQRCCQPHGRGRLGQCVCDRLDGFHQFPQHRHERCRFV